MWRFLLYTIGVVVLGGLAVGLGLLFMLQRYGQGLPDYTQLANYDPPVVSRLYANDGSMLCEYAVENRVFVPIKAIPQHVVNAFIAAEDKNFYAHAGVDFTSVLRAIAINITNVGNDRRLVGASTITQQVAKNFLLTNELSYKRKIKEAILAFRIEKAYNKDKILELYLNEIYLGNGAYGVAAAAINYFDKPLDELSIEEAAFLASLPKAPNNYQPDKHYDAAMARRNWAIDRMVEEGYVTKKQANDAKAKPISVRKLGNIETVRADYFCEEVRRILVQEFGEDMVYKGGLVVRTTLDPKTQLFAERAFHDGLVAYDRRHGWHSKPLAKIKSLDGKEWHKELLKVNPPIGNNVWTTAVVLSTSNDGVKLGLRNGQTGFMPFSEMTWARKTLPEQKLGEAPKKPSDLVDAGDVIVVEPIKQSEAKAGKKGKEAAVEGGIVYALRQIPNVNGGFVVMEPHTGRVLAMVGGYSFAASEFNRATQAMRQTGSAIKPLVYLSGLEHGLTPATLILDAPIAIEQGPGLPLWEPENYSEDYAGPATMRYGLEQSRNLMTVRLAQAVGIENVIETIERFGVAKNLPPQYAIALGAWETTLVNLTAAYATVDNGGKKVTPYIIDRVQDRRGETLYRADERTCPGCNNIGWKDDLVPPAIADTREQIIDPATAYQLISMMQGVVDRGTARRVSVVGKPIAGKTGTTNDARDAWFIGFTPDLVAGVYVGFDQPRTLGPKETGASVAAPIFTDFMLAALKNEPAQPFRVPPGIRLMPVDLATGNPATPGEPGVIMEAFKSETSWYGNNGVIEGGELGDFQFMNSVNPEGESTRLDGIY